VKVSEDPSHWDLDVLRSRHRNGCRRVNACSSHVIYRIFYKCAKTKFDTASKCICGVRVCGNLYRVFFGTGPPSDPT